MLQKIWDQAKKINDDGWKTSCGICVVASWACCYHLQFNFLLVLYVAGGMLYEQTVEWLAHHFLQHGRNRTLVFFKARHMRHHRDPVTHHALQPVVIFVPVVLGLLMPFVALIVWGTPIWRSNAGAVIVGFLLTHAVLNIEHYDIHAKKKIVPRTIRNTRYYQAVIRYHQAHHAHIPLSAGVYGITNPWFDLLLHKMKIDAYMRQVVDRGLSRFDRILYG